MTAHWIGADTLQRKSAALACARVTGKHTFDVIADKIYKIHSQYHKVKNIVVTITDNGSNFVKVFKEYSTGEERTATDTGIQTVLQQEEDGQISFVNMGQILDDNITDADDFELTSHQRCVAHTMNLIATNYSKGSEKDVAYKKLSRSIMGKCSKLRNKSHRSTPVTDLIQEKFASAVISPNTTHWNCYFDAMDKLHIILNSDTASDENLAALYDAVGIDAF